MYQVKARKGFLKRNSLKTLFIATFIGLLSVNSMAQTQKAGGISLQSGISSLGSTQWMPVCQGQIKYSPYISNQLGYKRIIMFDDSRFGLDYSFNLMHNRYKVNLQYYGDRNMILSEGSLSVPVSLRYGITRGNTHFYASAGVGLNLSLYSGSNYSLYTQDSEVFTGAAASEFNHFNWMYANNKYMGGLSLSSQFSLGMMKQINDNNCLELSLNCQLLDLLSTDGYNFGDRNLYGENDNRYYFPMNLSVGATWYFGKVLKDQ